MKKLNYSGILCLHPYFSKQWLDFKRNNLFSIPELCDFQNIILKSSLLVTDYSSIFFDFAYLKKPIVYAQFDYEEYRRNHFPKGYFDYKIDGFGPICFDLNCTINNIISILENECLFKKQYLERAKKFFKFTDGKNCERLFLYLNKSINSDYIYKESNLLV